MDELKQSRAHQKVVEEWKTHLGLHWYDDMLLTKEMPSSLIPRIKSFKFAESDILISTYPRSGTTWSQEMTWLVCNNADTETAKQVDLDSRSRFIEYSEPHMEKSNIEYLESTPPPRLIKTHFPPQYFETPKRGFKTIIVMRNLKDVMVSHFHFYKDLFGFKGTWDDFFEMFKQDFMFHGSWVKHCLKCWELRDDPNVLILKYEDVKQDHSGAIRKIAKFCGKTLSEEQVDMIATYTFVDNMKKRNESTEATKANPSYKAFIRKGKVGNWRKWFTSEQNEYVDELLKRTTEAQGLIFDE